MSDYGKSAAAADRMLKRRGGPVTLRRKEGTRYDTSTSKTVAVEVDYPGVGVKLGYEADLVDGTLIRQGDEQIYLSPVQVSGEPMPPPSAGDSVVIAGASHTIASVQKVEPVDIAVLYILQVRGL